MTSYPKVCMCRNLDSSRCQLALAGGRQRVWHSPRLETRLRDSSARFLELPLSLKPRNAQDSIASQAAVLVDWDTSSPALRRHVRSHNKKALTNRSHREAVQLGYLRSCKTATLAHGASCAQPVSSGSSHAMEMDEVVVFVTTTLRGTPGSLNEVCNGSSVSS